MKSILTIVALLVLPVTGSSGGNASVNFEALKDHLMAYYFSDPANADLKSQLETAVREEEKFNSELQKKIKEGSPIDIPSLEPMSGEKSRYMLERRIESDLRKELYFIVSGLGLEYDFIYDASDSEAIIFAKSPVDDLTTIVKQAILDHLSKKSLGQSKPDAQKDPAAPE